MPEIKLQPEIQSHWIWNNDKHLKWWCLILFNTQSEYEVLIGDDTFVCKKGQSTLTLTEWANMFNCSKKTVVDFFRILEKDHLIETKTVGKGNRRKHLLTVHHKGFLKKWKPETTPKTTPKESMKITIVDIDKIEDEEEQLYAKMAKAFYQQFSKNSQEVGIKFTTLRNEDYEKWVDPLRKLIKIDGYTIKEIREVFKFLREDPFWKENIRHTEKFRKRDKERQLYFEQILIKARYAHKKPDRTSQETNTKSKDYHEGL